MLKKGCVALSMTLHTSVDYFMGLPLDELNEYAEIAVSMAKEVARHGKQ